MIYPCILLDSAKDNDNAFVPLKANKALIDKHSCDVDTAIWT